MAKTRRTEVTVDAPVRQGEPVIEIEIHEPQVTPLAVDLSDLDPINEGSAFVRELRANLRAQGVTGAAQDELVSQRWATRNR